MTTNTETTPASPGGKQSQAMNMLSKVLDIVLVPILAVFTALVIGGILIVVTDATVYAAFREGGFLAALGAAWSAIALAYGALYSGSLGDADAISESLVASTPFIFAGLAVAFGFRGGLFNIGGEGQLMVAAGASVVIGYSFQLPAIIHLPLALLGGIVAGAIYGAIPGYLKAKTGAHEVINTIMMNYIAFLFFSWAFTGFLRRPGGNVPVTSKIHPSAYLPQLFEGYRFHWGFFLALLVAFGVWWLLFKTTLGFEIRMVGANPNAARYGGIKIGWVIVLTMAISGALAGMAGGVQVLGLNHFLADGFSPGFGFDAIALAFKEDFKRWRLLFIPALGLLGVALLWSYARSAQIGLWVGLLVILMAWSGWRRRVGIGLTALPVVAILTLPVVRTHFFQLFSLEKNITRINLWESSWQGIKARPWLGFGPGNFEDMMAIFEVDGFYNARSHSHHDFLMHGVNSGILGVLAALALLLTVSILMWRVWREGGSNAWLALACLAAQTAITVAGFFQVYQTDDEVEMMLYFLLGCGLALSGKVTQKDSPNLQPSP